MTDLPLTPPFRAEHIGSLLRPRALKDAAKARIRQSLSMKPLSRLEREIASVAGAHLLNEDEQKRKLALVAEIAEQV